MLRDIDDKVQARVERHLAVTPRFATLHGLLFTLSVMLSGLITMMAANGTGFPTFLYLLLLLWSVPLALHSTFAFWQSGAWRGRRSRLVHEEVLDAGETYDLSTEEMIDLHLRVDEAVRKQSQPFNRVLLYGVGNMILWPGAVLAMMGMAVIGINWLGDFTTMMLLMFMGTLALALLLPFGQLRYLLPGGTPVRDQYRRDTQLREMYTHKRKRQLSEAAQRLADVYDQDEALETDEIVEIKRKAR